MNAKLLTAAAVLFVAIALCFSFSSGTAADTGSGAGLLEQDELIPIMSVCGDSNGDGSVDLSDAVHILNYLFLGGDTLQCLVTAQQDRAECHSGAVDDQPMHQTDTPDGRQWSRPRLPEKPAQPSDCQCKWTEAGIEGPKEVQAGCPSPRQTDKYEDNGAPEYKATAVCTGGAELCNVVWTKTADAEAILNGSAPFRWSDDSGNNRMDPAKKGAQPRVDFRSKFDGANKSSCLKAPMCSAGKYEICAYPIYKCGDKKYQGERCCITVTAKP